MSRKHMIVLTNLNESYWQVWCKEFVPEDCLTAALFLLSFWIIRMKRHKMEYVVPMLKGWATHSIAYFAIVFQNVTLDKWNVFISSNYIILGRVCPMFNILTFNCHTRCVFFSISLYCIVQAAWHIWKKNRYLLYIFRPTGCVKVWICILES